MSQLSDYFVYKCWKGLQERSLSGKEEYEKRLQFEINTILRMGYPGYFLIVQDFIDWARANDIYVGPGRGSAAGSLVSYSLGITNLDPIRWKLLFERFLNPDRISMPDIDVDIEKRFRERVIKYVMDKYGHDRVGHIGTFNLMRAKAAVKSVARTLGAPYATGDKLSKLLLDPLHGKPRPLKESIEEVSELKAYHSDQYSTEGEILRWALKIEDMISSIGVHASGIVVANEPLVETVPIFKSKEGQITTQFEMNNIEEVGLIKFDFLGLDALTKIHRTIDLIKELKGQEIDIDTIDIEDPEVFEKLRGGDHIGVFQLEASTGMRDLMVQIRPTSVEDLVALVAIFRPGPLGADYKEVYLGVRAGVRDPEYLVPELEPILSRTSGWLIYQEQIMEIAKTLAGYTGGEADELRKAVGKKKKKLMEKHEPKFIKGWTDHGLPAKEAKILWDDMVKFAAYGFNRSHAAAYAMITYQTAWLKTHYPTEFMCAMMQCESEDKNRDKIIQAITECKRLGIKILAPDINKSTKSFKIDNEGSIRFGLGPIKNLGESVNAILEEKDKNGDYISFRDFCERVDLGIVNRRKLESLVRAGVFDFLGRARASLMASVENIWEYRKLHKAWESKMLTFHKRTAAYATRLAEIDDGSKKKPLKLPEMPEEPVFPDSVIVAEMEQTEIQKAEHELLGFFVTSHPLDALGSSINSYNSIESIKETPSNTKISTACVITSCNEITTKAKKQKMAFLNVEDPTGSIEVTVFPALYGRNKQYFEDISPIRIDGVVDVTETDEKRVTKIRATRFTSLHFKTSITPDLLEITMPVGKSIQLAKIVKKYAGSIHRVRISLKLQDGTIIKPTETFHIGNFKGVFIEEIARLQLDESSNT